MKYLLLMILFLPGKCLIAQKKINDESMRYQQERMVFKQWDKKKFTPTSGLLGLNPYYWLTWGLMPGYKKTDLRPLSATGPQTQRLGLVGVMNETERSYKLESDTLRNTTLIEIATHSGVLSATDPLWVLYYSKELKPVMEHSANGILSPLPAKVQAAVISEGLYNWYKHELEILKERLDGARTADMDRGSRILAYHRMLMEYRTLAARWAIRTASAGLNIGRAADQQAVRGNRVEIQSWTPESDAALAREIVRSRKF
ncbi:hypothetical protein [Pedobacter sp. MC2016-24]|uniref:hypothetical protein n=1 Tax=Pedobacter sp. MC2016-24 TaxID=2780090 RepID=UPI0018823DBA|nr:hypothetical protein [Pedobacter sp. MC2016-24]MBE9599899.1 hypothetical protein [Pedobacter sp. MC2016-24]